MALENFYENPKNVRIRELAIHFMLENKKISDVLVLYLALNYFDKFFSRHGIMVMEERMSQEIELLAVSCLSLAFKMRFKGEGSGINYSGKINEVERRICSVLGNMKSVTALSFAPHHYRQLLGAELPSTASIIIVEAQGDVRFTKFRPSVISAASVLTAIADLYPQYIMLFPVFVKSLEGIDKVEQLRPCFIQIVEMCKKKKLLQPALVEKRLWYLEPTKGPKLKISLKWSADIHGCRISTRLAVTLQKIDAQILLINEQGDPMVRDQLEKPCRH